MMSKHQVFLRPYEPSDAETFHQTYLSPSCSNVWRHFRRPLKKAMFDDIEAHLSAVVLTIETEDGCVTGFIGVQALVETTAIVTIVLLPDFQHKGICRIALTALMAWLKERRYHKASGMVSAAKPGFFELLKSIGWEQEGLLKKETLTVDGWQDEILMAVNLDDWRV